MSFCHRRCCHNSSCSKVSRNGVSLSSTVRAISLSGCSRLTDRGLALVARRCHLLQVCFPQTSKISLRDLFDTVLIQELEIQACPLVTNGGLLDLTSRCHHLNHLDVQVKRVTKSKSVLFLKIISPGLSYGVCSWSGCRGVHSPFGNSGEFSNICQITWAENFGRQACLLCLFFPTLKQLCVWRN